MEETYCSDEIEVVLVDNSGPAPTSAHLDDSDSVKIIITMSCDPQTAAQLEESVKQSLLENAQVRITLDWLFFFKICSICRFKAHECSVSASNSSVVEMYDDVIKGIM